jgi:hypothetical protein
MSIEGDELLLIFLMKKERRAGVDGCCLRAARRWRKKEVRA